MSGFHSSIDKTAMSAMPQHIVSEVLRRSVEATALQSRARARGRGRSFSSATLAAVPLSISATCCLVMAFTLPMGNALSLSTASSKSLVNQARMIRELKHHGQVVIGGAYDYSTRYDSPQEQNYRGDRLVTTKPLIHSDALPASLFDDFANSLESAIYKTNHGGPSSSSSEKNLAEEYDRFMAEDAALASMILENTKPGSLVDEVKQSMGVDIVDLEDDLELRLQREAATRRRFREHQQKLTPPVVVDVEKIMSVPSSPRPSITIMRRSKLAAAAVPAKQRRLLTRTSSEKLPPSPLLSREQEYALARTIQAGTRVHNLKVEYESAHSQPLTKKAWAQLANMSPNELRKLISDYRIAKQELVSSNMGLVRAVVKSQYARKAFYRGVPMEELIQEGSLGLIRAAELFDPAKGLRFSTYATIWIKGVLSNTNSLDEVINLPNREKAIWSKIKQAMEDMANEASGDGKTSPSGLKKDEKQSSEEVLASKLGMDVSMVQQHLRRMNSVSKVLSLDYQYASTTRSGFADGKQEALQSSFQFGTDADLAERAQFKADILSGLVRNLTQREVTLMRLRYGLEDGVEYTVKECAAKMGINRETIRKLQHSCLNKLRSASNMESLQEYLLTVA